MENGGALTSVHHHVLSCVNQVSDFAEALSKNLTLDLTLIAADCLLCFTHFAACACVRLSVSFVVHYGTSLSLESLRGIEPRSTD